MRGKKRGKKLGYPTANISFKKNILTGIYISIVRYKKRNYPSVTFIGNATTFGEKKIFAESYIFDFDKTIYNKWIKVRLIKKIRENQKFKDSKTLVAKIKKDVDEAKKYFKE